MEDGETWADQICSLNEPNNLKEIDINVQESIF